MPRTLPVALTALCAIALIVSGCTNVEQSPDEIAPAPQETVVTPTPTVEQEPDDGAAPADGALPDVVKNPTPVDTGVQQRATGEVVLGPAGTPVAYRVAEGDTAVGIAARFDLGDYPSGTDYLDRVNADFEPGIYHLGVGDILKLVP